MKTIAIVNEKGGTGKTATAVNLAAELVARGKSVLCIDMDYQHNLTTTWGADEPARDVSDVLLKGAPVRDIILKKEGMCDLLPGSKGTKQFENRQQFGAEFVLHDALKSVSDHYDYCIIDTPPFIGKSATAALIAADYCVVPCNAESYSIDGLLQLNETIAAIQRHGAPDKHLVIAGILLTRYRGNLKLTASMEQILAIVAGQIGTRVFDSKIRETVSVKEAIAMEQSCRAYDPRCIGAQDYATFTDELLKEVG